MEDWPWRAAKFKLTYWRSNLFDLVEYRDRISNKHLSQCIFLPKAIVEQHLISFLSTRECNKLLRTCRENYLYIKKKLVYYKPNYSREFRLSIAICPAYNANFDGDHMCMMIVHND